MFNEYLNTLSGVYDNFLESHILNSKYYLITNDDIEIGYFAVFEEKMLTQFYVKMNDINNSQAYFKHVINEYKIINAFVPTCDELFLSLALDNKRDVELQAYFFSETDKKVEPPVFKRDLLRLAVAADHEMIRALSVDFFGDLEKDNPDEEIYVLEDNNTVYGFGIIVKNNIHTAYRGTGMFTVDVHRKKGVGRSIILHLKEICHENGFKGLPGCWYYNHSSKKTLESCGYISKTRLLNIKF